jgi:fimbrial chaperone protein
LEATDELIVSPPLIEIPANGEQLVRLVRRTMRPIEAEQSYRLLIDEVPMPDEPTVSGVTLRLRYSVPVFIKPSLGDYRPRLD